MLRAHFVRAALAALSALVIAILPAPAALAQTRAPANTFYAGPTTGASTLPSFRSITAADLAVISGSNSQFFNTRAAAAAATIPASTGTVQLGGYSAAGDGGQGAIYIRYASACSPAWTFASADGQCWILTGSDTTPYYLGATGNGTTDDSTALQNWLNFCGTLQFRCRLAAGTYALGSASLTVSSGSTIVGDGAAAILKRTAVANTAVLALTSNVKTVLSNFSIIATITPTTVTISNASPGVMTGMTLSNTSAVWLTTTGTLPNPLTTTTPYYVVSTSGSTARLSLTMGGSAINTTTNGSGTHSATSSGLSYGVKLVGSSNTTVSNLRISGAFYYGIEDQEGTANRILNNHILGPVNRGIYLTSTTNSYGAVAQGNYVNGTDNYTSTTQFTTYCVNINDYGTGHNNGYLVDGNYLANCLGDGLAAGGLSYGVISNNNVTNSGASSLSGSGIVVERANGNNDIDTIIANNKVDGAYRGILSNTSDHVKISGNLVKSSGLNGIESLASSNVSITGNLVRLSTNNGINCETTSTYCSVIGNHVESSTGIGIYSAATTSNGTYLSNATNNNGTATSFNGTSDTTGSGGSVAGSNTQVQFNNSSAFGASANLRWVSPKLTIGNAGSTAGQLAFENATSGSIIVQPTTGALGTVTLTLPAATDTFGLLAANQAFTNKTYNGNTWTAGTGTLTIAASKTLTASNSITLAGTDSTTMTFPSVSATIPRVVASGAKALATSAISSGACSSAQTDTATGTLTTDAVSATFAADPTAVTGYSPSTSGMLTIIPYLTADTVNFKVCNNTSGSITPGAITLNWRVVR
jgi:hypothetical protein